MARSWIIDESTRDDTSGRAGPLHQVWPIVYLDALVVRVRDKGVAIGVNLDGTKEVMGLWTIERRPASVVVVRSRRYAQGWPCQERGPLDAYAP